MKSYIFVIFAKIRYLQKTVDCFLFYFLRSDLSTIFLLQQGDTGNALGFFRILSRGM